MQGSSIIKLLCLPHHSEFFHFKCSFLFYKPEDREVHLLGVIHFINSWGGNKMYSLLGDYLWKRFTLSTRRSTSDIPDQLQFWWCFAMFFPVS